MIKLARLLRQVQPRLLLLARATKSPQNDAARGIQKLHDILRHEMMPRGRGWLYFVHAAIQRQAVELPVDPQREHLDYLWRRPRGWWRRMPPLSAAGGLTCPPVSASCHLRSISRVSVGVSAEAFG